MTTKADTLIRSLGLHLSEKDTWLQILMTFHPELYDRFVASPVEHANEAYLAVGMELIVDDVRDSV